MTLVNGAMQRKPTTLFKTTSVHPDVTEQSVGRLVELNNPPDETTWHEVRFKKGANQIASIQWKRVMTGLNGFKENEQLDKQTRDPKGNFDAIQSNAAATSSEQIDACKIVVHVKVDTPDGVTSTTSVNGGTVTIVVKDSTKTLIEATLDPIAP